MWWERRQNPRRQAVNMEKDNEKEKEEKESKSEWKVTISHKRETTKGAARTVQGS